MAHWRHQHPTADEREGAAPLREVGTLHVFAGGKPRQRAAPSVRNSIEGSSRGMASAPAD